MRTTIVCAVLAVCLVGTGPVAAQEEGQTLNTEIQHFHPVADGQGVVVTESAATLGLLKPSFGVMFNYGVNPLVVYQIDSSNQQVTESQKIVANQAALDIQAAIGFKYASLAVSFPMNLAMSGDDELVGGLASASGFSLGDLRIIPKGRIVDPLSKKFGVAIAVPIIIPTGSPENYTGDPTVRIAPMAILGYQSRRFRVFLNAGAMIRPAGDETPQRGFLDLNLSHEFLISLGLGVKPHPIAEINLELFGNVGGPANANPFEWAVGATIQPISILNIKAGIGTALSQGYGAPVFRAYVGVGVAFTSTEDSDGDGVVDKDDMCPAEPEDMDGVGDHDGCPENDQDGDGILDGFSEAERLDQCPEEPETFNGIEDEDGCADQGDEEIRDDTPVEELPEEVDSDGDGIPDMTDDCPEQKEDPDGFESEDGCPDLDNDQDGITDALDDCPDVSEVFNLKQDSDGCPDEGGLVTIERTNGRFTRIVLSTPVSFDGDAIAEDSTEILNEVARLLQAYTEILKVEIQGPGEGSASVATKRADAVSKYISERGVEIDRLSAVGKAGATTFDFIVREQE